jgi:two-component system phosphate regulon sensor histidine kinase PhoR
MHDQGAEPTAVTKPGSATPAHNISMDRWHFRWYQRPTQRKYCLKISTLPRLPGYVETLADPDAKVDEATAARFHATVLRESRRLQSLVEDLMSLSRIEAEKHEVPRDRIDLGQLVGSIGSEVAMTAGDDRIEVDTTEAVVGGDRQQLDQLVRNLIDNAFKYGDQTAPVKVKLSVNSGEALLTVTDKGEGIHPDHLPYLTRRFYRTDPGRSRTAGGTGLGLAIVKHIVERHRGKLDIASTLGVGTTVSVRIPLAGPVSATTASPPASSLS